MTTSMTRFLTALCAMAMIWASSPGPVRAAGQGGGGAGKVSMQDIHFIVGEYGLADGSVAATDGVGVTRVLAMFGREPVRISSDVRLPKKLFAGWCRETVGGRLFGCKPADFLFVDGPSGTTEYVCNETTCTCVGQLDCLALAADKQCTGPLSCNGTGACTCPY
jgi:hypothetical protein